MKWRMRRQFSNGGRVRTALQDAPLGVEHDSADAFTIKAARAGVQLQRQFEQQRWKRKGRPLLEQAREIHCIIEPQ